MSKAIRSDYILLFLASLLLSFLYCPPVDLLRDDQGVFQYAGMLIAKGGVPYLDLFDHKPPMIYFVDWAAFWLGSWGPWIIDALLVGAATLLFYRRCREKQFPYPWILPLFFNLLFRNYILGSGVGTTRAFTTIFLVLAFCVLQGRSRYSSFWLGMLAGATLLMQQEQFLLLLPFLVYSLPAGVSDTRLLLKRIVQSAAGFLVIAGPILLYFGIHHALTAFWNDAFVFNWKWYSDRRPFSEEFRATHASLIATDLVMIVPICITLAFTALLLHPKEKKLIIAALLSTVLAFFPVMFSGRIVQYTSAFYYYFTPFSAVLPILVFTAWAATGHPFLTSRISHAVFGFLLCAAMGYNALEHATHLTLHNDAVLTARPEYQILRQQHLQDGQFYAFGNNTWTYVYNDLKILAPSPWIYQHFWNWYPQWDNDHRLLKSIGLDLLAHHTRYIIDVSERSTFIDPGAYSCWKTFLQQYYRPVQPPGSHRLILWQLKTDSTIMQ